MQLTKRLTEPVRIKSSVVGAPPVLAVQTLLVCFAIWMIFVGESWLDVGGVLAVVAASAVALPCCTEIVLYPEFVEVRSPFRRRRRVRLVDVSQVRFVVMPRDGMMSGVLPPIRLEFVGTGPGAPILLRVNAKMFSRAQLSRLGEYLEITG